jgi:hypothetical protein
MVAQYLGMEMAVGGAVRVFRAARVVVVVKVEGLVAPVGSVGAGMARLVAV